MKVYALLSAILVVLGFCYVFVFQYNYIAVVIIPTNLKECQQFVLHFISIALNLTHTFTR